MIDICHLHHRNKQVHTCIYTWCTFYVPNFIDIPHWWKVNRHTCMHISLDGNNVHVGGNHFTWGHPSVQPGYRLTRFTQLHTPLFAISITADHVKKVRRGKKVRTKVPERWRYVDLDYFKVTSMCLKAILHNCVR